MTFTFSKHIIELSFTVSKIFGGEKMNKTIEILRIEQGISQTDMAQRLGLPISTYNTYENGNRKVPEAIAYKIAKILNVKVEDIFLPATFTISKSKNINNHTA